MKKLMKVSGKMNLHEMKFERNSIARKMRALNDEIGEKEFKPEQRKKWEALKLDLEKIDVDIEKEEERRRDDQRFVEQQSGFRTSAEQWRDLRTGKEIRVYKPGESVFNSAGGGKKERFNFGSVLRGLAIGARDGEPELREALTTVGGSSGAMTVPAKLLESFIDAMRAKQQTINAGAMTVLLEQKTVSIARIKNDAVPTWRAEAGKVTESKPTLDRVEFDSKSLAVLVKVSEELLQDSANIDSILMGSLSSAMALELDRVAINGSGSDTEPEGVLNTTGINTITGTAAINSYELILTGCKSLAIANSNAPTAAIMNPVQQYDFAGLVATDGQPINRPKIIEDLPFLDTNSAPDKEMLMGDFTKMMIGIRQGLSVRILTERYADEMCYGFLCTMRADIALEQPKAFCKVIIPSDK